MVRTRRAKATEPDGSPRHESCEDAGPRLALQTMTVALAISALVHHAILGDWRLRSVDSLVVVAALVALLRPGPASLVCLAAATLLLALVDYPDVSNHLVLTATLALAVLVTVVSSAVIRNGLVRSPHRLWFVVGPCARTALLITYSFAALAKLNRGFLTPVGSCAVSIYEELAGAVRLLPEGSAWYRFVIWLVVAVECSLPFLLLWRRTRLIGLAIGTVFHLGLVAAGHGAFSAAALAFYVAFLPMSAFDRARCLARRSVRLHSILGSLGQTLGSSILLGAAMVVWVALSRWSVLDPSGRRISRIAKAAEPVTIGIIVVAAAVAVLALRGSRTERWQRNARSLPRPGWFAMTAVLLVMGASPYLGLKTTSSFTMYSNLRTEGGAWNHVLIPSRVQIFDFQERLVSFVHTEDPALAEYVESGDRLVWYDFVEHRRAENEQRVVIEIGGRHIELGAGDPFGPLDEPSPAVDKLLAFRAVPRQNRCLH